MWRHYVYVHRKADAGAVFYVGKGTERARKKSLGYERAKARDSRSSHWRNVVAKHGLVIEIVATCATDEDAQSLERALIAQYGRETLVNLTDGGDGSAGLAVSDELRRKRSLNARGQRSPTWVESIRRARKNGGNGGVVKHGDKLPKEWVENLARAKIGENNPYYGRPTAVSKKVVNVKTGVVYDSISIAAKAEGVALGALYSYLDGSRRNKTDLARL